MSQPHSQVSPSVSSDNGYAIGKPSNSEIGSPTTRPPAEPVAPLGYVPWMEDAQQITEESINGGEPFSESSSTDRPTNGLKGLHLGIRPEGFDSFCEDTCDSPASVHSGSVGDADAESVTPPTGSGALAALVKSTFRVLYIQDEARDDAHASPSVEPDSPSLDPPTSGRT
ncbi:hypothetical protein VTO73DRAFT_9083 [Trametes versicolor]